jgi:dolichol kinase
MLEVLAGCALTAVGLAAAEAASRLLRLSEFAARKTLHVVASLACAAGGLWLGREAYVWVGLAFFGVMAATRLIPTGALTTLATLRRGSWGEIWFPLGIAGAAWLAPDAASFATVALVLGLADTAAAAAGRRWPGRPLIWGKTLAGSTACFAVAAAVLTATEGWAWGAGLGLLATGAEAVGPRGLDNLAMPLALAAALRILV